MVHFPNWTMKMNTLGNLLDVEDGLFDSIVNCTGPEGGHKIRKMRAITCIVKVGSYWGVCWSEVFLPWGSCEKVSTFLSVESSLAVEFYEGYDVKDLGLMLWFRFPYCDLWDLASWLICWYWLTALCQFQLKMVLSGFCNGACGLGRFLPMECEEWVSVWPN